VFQAVCQAVGTLKEKMMEHSKPEIEDQHVTINRLITINSNSSKNKYAKRGILFTTPTETIPKQSIDLYNQGCPVKTWNVEPEKIKRNEFKIFSTGDAFSIVAPEVEIKASNITIHVGVEHASYSPLVLLQEALQLCRCAQEQRYGSSRN
jgi:hypothetical protein